MIRGVSENWKQVIAWHATTKKSSDDVLHSLVLEIVSEVERIGFNIRGITCDMGPKNTGLWKKLGFKVNRKENYHYIDHPQRPGELLYVFADVPHLLKNLRTALMNQDFVLSEELNKKYNFPSRIISFKYIEQLISIQERNSSLRLASKLDSKLLKLSNFEKMNVAFAARIFSHRTAAALEFLIEKKYISEDARATVWFIKLISKWFNLMNSRDETDGIKSHNLTNVTEYLKTVLHVMQYIAIGDAWKPVQTGMKMSTQNVICLSHDLLSSGYQYVLTSRFNQDALENLFSTVRRHGNINPTVLQLKRCLRLITVCQFVDSSKSKQNYDRDNAEHYISFFNKKRNRKRKIDEDSDQVVQCVGQGEIFACELDPISDSIEQNIVNNLIGCAMSTVFQHKALCRQCIDSLIDENDFENFMLYTNILNKGALHQANANIVKYIFAVESQLQAHLYTCIQHPHLEQHLKYIVKKYVPNPFPPCTMCNSVNLLVNQYIHVRLLAHLDQLKSDAKKKKENVFASKSSFRQQMT